MATFNLDLFKEVVAPEFASKSDTVINTFADEAYLELSESVWGKRHPRAWALITAHLMAMADKSSKGSDKSTGQLRKTKVGQLEREYDVTADSNSKDGSYNLTTYGKEFIRLRKQVLIGPIIV